MRHFGPVPICGAVYSLARIRRCRLAGIAAFLAASVARVVLAGTLSPATATPATTTTPAATITPTTTTTATQTTIATPTAVETSFQASGLVFGPKQYLRTTGSPNQYDDSFTIPLSVQAPFVLHIVNGDPAGGHRVSSATITLNGVDLATPSTFSPQVGVIDRAVTLRAVNALHVTLASAPGSYLTIGVYGAPNHPPIANAGGPYTGTTGLSVAFTGSGSDPDADPLTFAWTFGDGTPAGSGPTPTHIYTTPGDFTATLTVSDGRGGSVSPTASVHVVQANRPPTGTAGGPYNGTTGVAVAFNGSGSDPDTDPLTFAWNFGDGTPAGSGPTPTHVYATPGDFSATLTVSDGRGGTVSPTASVHIVQANRPPTGTAGGPYDGTTGIAVAFNGSATDPDSDPLTFSWDFGDGTPAGSGPSPTHVYTTPGDFTATLTVTDGRGGTTSPTAAVHIAPPAAVLQTLSIGPLGLRFAAIGATQALAVTGHYSDNNTKDLTPGSTGTEYVSDNPFVAAVSADGVVSAVGNGSARITAHHGGPSADTSVVVEVGVALNSLTLAPQAIDLRSVGATMPSQVTGLFSDGTARDLTSANTGTTFESSDHGVATVSSDGVVTAVGNGTASITAANSEKIAQGQIHVAISGGSGFVRGEAYDDRKGLLLANPAATLIADGGGAVLPPPVVTGDARGAFALPGKQGDALVRIGKAGFTTVERVGSIPPGAAVTLLDARLTALDPHVNAIEPALAGVAANAAGDVTLTLVPGTVATPQSIRLTEISGQGLMGRLPYGWSPAAAIDIDPAGVVFQQLAQLRVPNAANLPAGTAVALAQYDANQHQWTGLQPAQVSADGRSLVATLDGSGQVAFLLPDEAPFTPPVVVAGQPLTGVPGAGLGPGATASGVVSPRTVPPGDEARAAGSVTIQSPTRIPSGLAVQAFVAERFDLFDSSRVVPPGFTEDIALYAKPAVSGAVLNATVPITPSVNFSIQELEHGVVTLDVAPRGSDVSGTVVGASGGTAMDPASGAAAAIPAGALASDTLVDVSAIVPGRLGLAAPAGLELLAALRLDVPGAVLAQSAVLSIVRPPSVANGDQIVVAEIIRDPKGVPRLRLVGLGAIQASRVALQTTLGALAFPGALHGGDYLFLKTTQPLGFVYGFVFAADGTTPQPSALVTSDTAAFADVTGGSGSYIVGAAVNALTHVTAATTAATTTGTVTVATSAQPVRLDLTLGASSLLVVATTPAAGATKVALNTPVIVQFSEPVVAATTSSIGVQSAGTPIAGTLSLSPDRRIATFLPAAQLHSNAPYTIALATALRGDSGLTLTSPPSIGFTTIDTSKPDVTPGQITANLPDADGLVVIFGTTGTSEPLHGVTAANLRTQETATVLAGDDGSFRLRLSAGIGDELSLTFRDAAGRETTLSITQLLGADGTTGLGSAGGTIVGAGGRIGTILPRALTSAGLFKITDLANQAALPMLPPELSYVDRFVLTNQGGVFNTLKALTLTESQNRFSPSVSSSSPFEALGSLVVPADFLVNGTIKVSATAEDAAGNRHAIAGSTLVVASNPDTSALETKLDGSFPTVFLTAPTQAMPAQQVGAVAIAPTARVDMDLPAPAALNATTPVLLTRALSVNGELKLSVRDQFGLSGGRLRTLGRELPGTSTAGSYAAVASSVPLVFVEGQISGPARIVEVENSPFVVETTEPNARFRIPVFAGQPFALDFIDPLTGQLASTTSGQAPPSGVLALNQPVGATGPALTVSATPDASSIVDINQPVVFVFSDAVDQKTLPGNIRIFDAAGIETLGKLTLSTGGTRVTFVPNRRWRFGATYRYTVSTSVLTMLGARLPQPFSAGFTTFAPRIVGALSSVGTLTSVAAAGNTVLAGGPAGLAVIDATHPETPAPPAQVPVPDGVGGVSLLAGAQLTDRTNHAVNGLLGFAATGSDTSVGQLQIYDLNATATPIRIGSTQLTTPSGQADPANVPTAPGTPRGIALTADTRALVGVQSIGVESVTLGSAIPPSASDPGGALGPRFPSSGFENVRDVAIVGNKAVAAGSAGLTILDATTLVRSGGMPTNGDAQAIGALSKFRMDVNGDGSIDSTTEIFDLAVVANGTDGTLQFFNVNDGAAPALISVVRLPGTASSVIVDAGEALGYIGMGSRGVAIVDLAGPASVQPIDFDRNSLDDRILGIVATRGAAGRVALDLSRGIAYVADGAAGLTVVDVLPPRARFTEILRDPVAAGSGDEQSILTTHQAYLTDDGLHVALTAVIPPPTALFLAINETRQPNDPATLSLVDGGTVARLASGTNTLVLPMAKGRTAPIDAALQIRSAEGVVFESFDVRLSLPDTTRSKLESIFIAPQSVTLDTAHPTAGLGVGGRFSDGRILNLTASSAGTTYRVAEGAVAAIDSEGVVTSVAGGQTVAVARNGARTATATVQVDGPAVLTQLTVTPDLLTFTKAGAQQPLSVSGRFTDGSVRDLTSDPGTTYASDHPDIASAGGDGLLTAIGEGTATITVTNGMAQASMQVAAEFRTPANITAIDLASFMTLITTDSAEASASATVAGTGSLEGLPVAFSVSTVPPVQVTALTGYGGTATAILTGLTTAGTFAVTAAVVNPAANNTLADQETLVVAPGSGDHEPNNDVASASRLTEGKTVTGTVGGGADGVDTYHAQVTTAGTLTVALTLPDGTSLGDLAIVSRAADGSELRRIAVTDPNGSHPFDVDAGDVFLTIERNGTPTGYTLNTSFKPAPLIVTSVTPLSGPVGTVVTISGSGFNIDPAQNTVSFATIAAKVVSASPTGLVVIVPANAIDGPMRIVSGDRQVNGPRFITGTAGPLPRIVVTRADPAMQRVDPLGGGRFFVNRLLVSFDPLVTRAQVDTIVQAAGGTVVGVIPTFNQYVVQFNTVTTIAGLETVRRTLESNPQVRFTARNTIVTNDQITLDTDVNSHSINVTNQAYQLTGILGALKLIRYTPPFDQVGHPRFTSVRVAIIDSGFDPLYLDEFREGNFDLGQRNGPIVVEEIDPVTAATDGQGLMVPVQTLIDNEIGGHGTEVSSIIAAPNGNYGMNGILNGLFQPDESPFHLISYRYDLDTAVILAALADIDRRNTFGDPVDVVNMSFGATFDDPTALDTEKRKYRPYFSANTQTLYVAAAGNASVDARLVTPASLAQVGNTGLPNVVAVGAVTVLSPNTDNRANYWPGTRESELARSGIFSPLPQSVLCTFANVDAGSNCGPIVTLAAPGRSVLAAASDRTGYAGFSGTSAAAPMVAGVAAVLQAIHPAQRPKYTPQELRDILVDSGDDLGSQWDDLLRQGMPSMKRLNALHAVLKVLPPLSPHGQVIYVADEDADNANVVAPNAPLGLALPPGKIVAMEVDPLTGDLLNTDYEIFLTFDKNGTQFVGRRPRSLVVSPIGHFLYALVTTDEPVGAPVFGDGVLVINTETLLPEDFIPLSGASFPSSPNVSAIVVNDERPGMAISSDGRLLYVATDTSITIVNIEDGEVVQTLSDLPDPYRASAPAGPPSPIAGLAGLTQTIVAENGTSVESLVLSPDGKRLYAAMLAGDGAGAQPGAVIPIDVDLSKPGSTPGTLDLSTYFSVLPVLRTPGSSNPSTAGVDDGDEPRGIAVSADEDNANKFLYLANGGYEMFIGGVPNRVESNRLSQQGAYVSGASGIPEREQLVVDQSAALLQLGVMELVAPSVVNVFDTPGNSLLVGSPGTELEFAL